MISAKSFYGQSPPETSRDPDNFKKVIRDAWLAKLLLLQSKARTVLTHHAKAEEQQLHWYVFGRQQAAFDFANRHIQNLHVFSFEVPGKEAQDYRKYLVTTYQDFWRRYQLLAPEDRHFYEVIPEGKWIQLSMS